jgi:hypothetical protein
MTPAESVREHRRRKKMRLVLVTVEVHETRVRELEAFAANLKEPSDEALV